MENKNFIITENNVKEYIEKISSWIKEKVQETKTKGVVLGMSGGVDCSVVARLWKEANIDIDLVLLPYGDSMEKTESYQDAMELINKFEFNYHVFNIKPAVDALKIEGTSNNQNAVLAEANLKPRIRMTYLYQYAQLNNLLVIGTGNLSERTIGYFTKWGDGASDINPMANITKKEVYILAKALDIPENIINKKPSAELWKGQNDEDDIGISYAKIDEFILNENTGKEKEDDFIEQKNKKILHKLKPIPTFNIVK